MKFTWDGNRYTLRSEDPNIFVQRFTGRPEGEIEMLLVMGERRVGFQLKRERRLDDSGNKIWTLINLCAPIHRQGKYQNNIMRFADKNEQSRVLMLIEEALSGFYDINSANVGVTSTVIIDQALQDKINNGVLIAQS